MSIFQAGAASSTLATILDSWKMSFSSVYFLLFLPLVLGGCFLLPKKLRPAFMLLCSWYFYFFAAPKYLFVLIGGTLVAWLCGLFIASRKPASSRRGAMLFSVGLFVLLLCFFKYNGFFAAFLSPFFQSLGVNYSAGYFSTAGALGISFYSFTAIGYLIDVSRGDVPAEKNPLYFALFLGFFPSVTMGPISRAGGLLPQLRALPGTRFEAARISEGLRRMAVGYFKKLAVADMLAVFTNQIFGNLPQYSGLTLVFGAVCFALQLYFDFSGYSDIAIGTARLFGIKLPENFNTPYFSTNFSGFWPRWHISLSSWLQDYIFTPLVWSRWTEKLPILGKRVKKPPVLTSLLIVFLVSGIWHGDTLCFLVWGALMALYRIGEELLHRLLGKPKKNPSLPRRIGKTLVVFVLWVEGLVFFKVGMTEYFDGTIPGVGDAFAAIGRQFTAFSPSQTLADILQVVRDGFFPKSIMVLAFLLFTLFCLVLAIWADWAQFNKLGGAPVSQGIAKLKAAPRWVVYYLLVLCSFAALIAQAGGNFLYGGF